MPELPDVELQKRYLGRTALHRRIEAVSLRRAGRLLEHVGVRRLEQRLRGRVLDSARRHGKLLFVGLDDGGGTLVLHFGMTGFLKYHRRADSAPDHPRMVLELDDGYRLVYDCQRLFGHIGLCDGPEDWIEAHDLGPDALELDADGFIDVLSGRRGTIKSALMNQSVLAGLGNVYSDEILFRARLHPDEPLPRLDERSLRALHRSLRHVLEGAIRHRADPDRVPRSWLLPHRHEGASCPRCGAPLERIESAGRPAWICGSCQRR